jgi:hypothetical protein
MTVVVSAEFIDGLQERLNQIYALDPGWKTRGEWPAETTGAVLHPPASPEQIDAYEQRLGTALPPSYRAFLRLHGGWEHFWGDVTLTGVSGDHTERLRREVEEYTEFKRNELAGRLGDFSPASIAVWEAESPRHLYLPNHVAFGTNFGGELWLFDARTTRADGEMPVVYWTVDYGVWTERTLEDFPHYLQWASSMVDRTLKRLRDRGKKSLEKHSPEKRRQR